MNWGQATEASYIQHKEMEQARDIIMNWGEATEASYTQDYGNHHELETGKLKLHIYNTMNWGKAKILK
jgi:hypothetical protein